MNAPTVGSCTTPREKTLKVFKGMEPKAIPPDIEARLMAALKRMKKDRGGICGEKVDV